MPLFDYHCSACQTVFERLQRADAPAPTCPGCGSAQTERALSRLAPPGQSAAIVASARRQAAREGHFSHYSRAERAKLR